VEALLESYCHLGLPYQLPPTSVAVPKDQTHVYFHVNSFFNTTHRGASDHPGDFTYPIEFSIERDAFLDVAMTYSVFSNAFVLELYREDSAVPGGWTEITVGDFSTVGLEQGDVSNYLQIDLYRSRATKYRVVIGMLFSPFCS
jgi:hypothetical protein